MSSILDTLAQQERSLSPEEQTQLNHVLARVPQGQLREAVTSAVKELPSEDYYAHTEPGVNGTDPFGSLAKADLTRVVGSVLGALTSKGVTPAEVAQQTGAATSDPKYVTSDDMARIVQWLQQQHPDVLGQVAEHYQANPNILQTILGNKALMTAIANVGADKR
jgi:hypothetical protein